MDHIIKNCPQLKEDQEAESPKKLFRKKGGNNAGKKFTKAMLAAWGDSTDEEEGSEEEEAEEAMALMARSEIDSDEGSSDSLIRLKNKVSGLKKHKLKEFLLILMDECYALHTENCDLSNECDELKMNVLKLKKVDDDVPRYAISIDNVHPDEINDVFRFYFP